jgi:hypothetical protein
LGWNRVPYARVCSKLRELRTDAYTNEKQMKTAMISAALMCWTLATVQGAETKSEAADEAVIHATVESYVAAFNRPDAKALAALWSPEAIYTNPIVDQ